jgi:ribonuclease HII
MIKYIIGIDEVGRGPIAGPVAVCALGIRQGQTLNGKKGLSLVNFKNFRDSKKLSHAQRLKWLEKIEAEKDKGNIIYQVCMESNKVIDKHGIVFAINNCLKNCLKNLNIKPTDCQILLDGGLRAPVEYKNQQTIIKGDEKKLAIALASIVAKVTRDNLLVKLAKKYPGYGLEDHKGYGTRKHYESIKKNGVSALHRKSFLKKLI